MHADHPDARPYVAAIIPAAGSGSRMGSTTPKQFLQFGGREIVAYTLDIFETCAAIDEVWLVVPAAHRAFCQQAIVARYGFRKVRDVVAGGVTRQESVWRGLQRVTATSELIMVHDGVRPFVPQDVLCATLGQAARHGAAITAVPVKDTLKRVSSDGDVETTVPREHLWRIQTPQAFRHTLLQDAFRHAWRHGVQATDEAGLVEALGHPVKIVPGVEHNVKVTTPDDLFLCETLTRMRTP